MSEIRSASPYYRKLLVSGGQLCTLPKFREHVLGRDRLALLYYLGNERSYLFLIDPATEAPFVFPLVISDSTAVALSEKPGPLRRQSAARLVETYLQSILKDANVRGLVGRTKSVKGQLVPDAAVAITETLLPARIRQQILTRNPSALIVIPDGALHQLPFECLMLAAGEPPQYIIDSFPPIAYAPSANILASLHERPTSTREPYRLIAVGNPQYPQPTSVAANPSSTNAMRDTFLDLGGRLPPLPGTREECQRIVRAFGEADVKFLEGPDATEGQVMAALPGCRFIHLAAHGLVDDRHGNLFGAIALSPPAPDVESASNDGFLKLHEIHRLNLTGCELAVLSACQTNVGPDRPLEAGSSLAQAFLTAGAKRVVSSHWSVADASTAELMGTFFEEIARELDQARPVNYALALQKGRQQVRKNAHWALPSYWAPFVLIGEPD